MICKWIKTFEADKRKIAIGKVKTSLICQASWRVRICMRICLLSIAQSKHKLATLSTLRLRCCCAATALLLLLLMLSMPFGAEHSHNNGALAVCRCGCLLLLQIQMKCRAASPYPLPPRCVLPRCCCCCCYWDTVPTCPNAHLIASHRCPWTRRGSEATVRWTFDSCCLGNGCTTGTLTHTHTYIHAERLCHEVWRC